MKCVRCGKGGLFRKINKETGLCNACSQEELKMLNSGLSTGENTSSIEKVTVQDNSHRSDGAVPFVCDAELPAQQEPEVATPVALQDEPSTERKQESDILTNEDLAAMGFDVDDMDDYDHLEAGKNRGEQGEVRDFTPDNPAQLREKTDEIAGVDETLPADFWEDDGTRDGQADDDIPVANESKMVAALAPQIHEPVEVCPQDEAEQIEYSYPPIELLSGSKDADESDATQEYMEKAHVLVEMLKAFGINCHVVGISHGPVTTRLEIKPEAGVLLKRIVALEKEIALHLAAEHVHIETPIPGKAAVGVEIPNDKVETVYLRSLLESEEWKESACELPVGLGKDNTSRNVIMNIAALPHVLIAGQIGSGKSSCLNAMIISLLYRATPEDVRLILISCSAVDMVPFNGIPHLLCPVVTDPKKAVSALDWAVAEMTKRYKLFAERGVRDIKSYNKSLKANEKPMPQMVIIIDELLDLMIVSPGEAEDSIYRLAQYANVCGIHLVIATRTPTVNVFTKEMRSCIPARIVFAMTGQENSKGRVKSTGTDKLLGNGDMLLMLNNVDKPRHIQGARVSDDEVHAVVSYIRCIADTAYDRDLVEHLEPTLHTETEDDLSGAYDPRLPEAVDIVLELGQASTSMLQRRMRVGYARAGKLIDELVRRGIISEADGSKPRMVLMSREQINQMLEE